MGDEGVGVARITNHQRAEVRGGALAQGLADRLEDPGVHGQQVAALLALPTRDRGQQQGPGDAVEGDVGIAGGDDAAQQRKGAVLQLHHAALKGRQRRFELQQMQSDGRIFAEHLARGEAVDQGVAYLSGGASDGDAHSVQLLDDRAADPPSRSLFRQSQLGSWEVRQPMAPRTPQSGSEGLSGDVIMRHG